MVIARLLAVGLLSTGVSVSSGRTDELPTTKLVVQAMHTNWPDGSPVESGGLNYPTDIYVVDVNGGHILNLTHDAPTNHLIGRLPAGQRILYESYPSDRMKPGPSRVFSIKTDGTGRRQLAYGKGPQLSPDRRRILFARGRSLYVMQSDGSHRRPLAQANFGYYAPGATEPYNAAWSPDGKRIVFVRGFAERQVSGSPLHPRSAIYVINADGTGLRRLTPVHRNAEAMNPRWAPDGRKIAFDEYRLFTNGPSNRFYVTHADGTGTKRLERLEGTSWLWLPNGRLAYDDGNGRYKSIDADGAGKPRALSRRIRVGDDLLITSGRLSGRWPVSPDGKWIALYTSRSTLSISHLDGSHRRLVSRKICCAFVAGGVEWAGK
jgi:dipeptidyl aminopeptidase/acylaminoacyl peptidase